MKITKAPSSAIDSVDFENLIFGTKFTDHMMICEFENGKWNEPEIRPYGPLTFTPALHTLHYGQAIFEGQKAYYMNQERIGIFRLEQNAKRMNASAKRMFMPEFPEEWFMEGIKKLVEIDREWVPKDSNGSLYLRPFMFGSSEFVAARPSEKFIFCVVMSPVGPYYSGNVKVKVEKEYSRSASGGVGFAKCAGNYGGAFYPTSLAKEEGYTQVVWTDAKNHELIEESGTMNIGMVIGDRFITPPISERILAGITRDSILHLLRDSGELTIEERPIKVAELIAVAQSGELKEVFGMGTAAVISPISTIGYNGKDYDVEVPENGYSAKLKARLTDIRLGRTEDKYGWMTII